MDRGPNILSYEDSLDLDGLLVTRSEGYFRVVTPQPRRWRAFGGWHLFGALYFSVPVLCVIVRGFVRGFDSKDAGMWLYSVMAGFLIACGVKRMYQRVIIELTSTQFQFRRTTLFGGKVWTYRRSAVRDIHRSRNNPKMLFLNIAGPGMFELYIGEDPAIVERLATVINDALKQPMDSPVLPALPATAPVAPQLKQSSSKSALVPTLVGVALAVGIGTAVVASWGAGLLVFGMIAAPIGIKFGTQKKDYWV